MLKKSVAILITFLLLISQFSICSLAAEPVEFTISGGNVYAGDEFTLNLSVSDNSKIRGMAIYITYDKQKLEFVSSDYGSILDSNAMMSVIDDNGCIKFVYLSTDSSITSAGKLLTLTFKARGNAVGNTKIEMSIPGLGNLFDENKNNLDYKLNNADFIILKNDSAYAEDETEAETEFESETETEIPSETEQVSVNENQTINKNDNSDNSGVRSIALLVTAFVGGVAVITVGFVLLYRHYKRKKR